MDADPRTNRMLVLREPEDRRIVVAPNWLAGVRLMLRAKLPCQTFNKLMEPRTESSASSGPRFRTAVNGSCSHT